MMPLQWISDLQRVSEEAYIKIAEVRSLEGIPVHWEAMPGIKLTIFLQGEERMVISCKP